MPKRNQQRGSVIVVAMLAMVALLSLGGLATLSVRGGLSSSGHDRFKTIAVYAAESGAVAGMEFLRERIELVTLWSAYVVPDNDESALVPLVDITGNTAQPGDPDNVFSADMNAWYEVVILNNRDDSGLSAGTDTDQRVIIRSTGYGPGGAVARIEWEVAVDGPVGRGRACTSYTQQNVDADGAGRQDCITRRVNATDVATYNPGNP